MIVTRGASEIGRASLNLAEGESGDLNVVLRSGDTAVDIYDPATNRFEAVASLHQGRALNAQLTLEQSRKQITEVTTKANDVLDTTRLQIGKVEDLLTDVTARAKVQMDRAELVLDDTLGRVQETVVLLHSGVMKPLREINGVSAGIRAAISHVLKGRRPSVAQATHDEEMFI